MEAETVVRGCSAGSAVIYEGNRRLHLNESFLATHSGLYLPSLLGLPAAARLLLTRAIHFWFIGLHSVRILFSTDFCRLWSLVAPARSLKAVFTLKKERGQNTSSASGMNDRIGSHRQEIKTLSRLSSIGRAR